MKILSPDFYLQEDVILLGQQLLGKYIFTKTGNSPITGGMIVETESYKGTQDKACHAYMGRKTKRNEVMYSQGGVAYVYICYGMHSLLNVVTNKKNIPETVLIYLETDKLIRRVRMLNRGDKLIDVETRFKEDKKHFRKSRFKHLDHIVNTSSHTLEELAEKIYHLYTEDIKNQK